MTRRESIIANICWLLGFISLRRWSRLSLTPQPEQDDFRSGIVTKKYSGTDVPCIEVESLIKEMHHQGWSISNMNCQKAWQHRKTDGEWGWMMISRSTPSRCYMSVELVFYRIMSDIQIAKLAERQANKERERTSPKFRHGCRWCGREAGVFQVPAPIAVSDCYCNSSDCVEKCRTHYYLIMLDMHTQN